MLIAGYTCVASLIFEELLEKPACLTGRFHLLFLRILQSNTELDTRTNAMSFLALTLVGLSTTRSVDNAVSVTAF
jgi:hypothetical protein